MSKFKLEKSNANIEFALDGKFDINIENFKLKNCRCLVICDGTQKVLDSWNEIKNTPDSLLFETKNDFGKWSLEFKVLSNNSLSLCLSGKTDKLYKDVKLIVLDLPEIASDHILTQGVTMGKCSSKLLKGIKLDKFDSQYLLNLTKDNSTLQMAFPMRQKQATEFKGDIEDGKILNLQAQSKVHDFGSQELKTDALSLKCSHNGFTLLQEYADESLEKEKDFSDKFAPGWNSWDYYRWTITEEEVLKNAEFIAKDPVLSKHVKRIIVDDGWQYCYGEWEANHHFPNGMKYLADQISSMGFEPGLWFAPTIVEPHAHIAQVDYDMLAGSEGGQPCLAYNCMERQGFVLDPTQPKVQAHLQKIFNRYADMGYKYFKLDFMGSTLNAKSFADKSVPRSDIPRLIVKSIHEAVSDRATILGCNYRFKGGTKYVDAVRIGSDIHAKWNSIKHNTISVAARFWANKKLWINDPDFALCRAFDTCNDPDINRLQACLVYVKPDNAVPGAHNHDLVDINRTQAEILLSVVLANGGAVNLSDKMYLLNDSGVDLARRTVAAESGNSAIPLDLFESNIPSKWLQEVGNHHRILLINWQDTEKEVVFDLKKHGINSSKAVNFWNDKNVKINNGRISEVLAPRSCLFATIG